MVLAPGRRCRPWRGRISRLRLQLRLLDACTSGAGQGCRHRLANKAPALFANPESNQSLSQFVASSRRARCADSSASKCVKHNNHPASSPLYTSTPSALHRLADAVARALALARRLGLRRLQLLGLGLDLLRLVLVAGADVILVVLLLLVASAPDSLLSCARPPRFPCASVRVVKSLRVFAARSARMAPGGVPILSLNEQEFVVKVRHFARA